MHVSFSDLGIAMLTLFRVCTNDNWSDIMAITSLEPPLRPLGFDDTVSLARVEISRYLENGNQTALVESKKLLRGCLTEEELYALRDVISCQNMVITPLHFDFSSRDPHDASQDIFSIPSFDLGNISSLYMTLIFSPPIGRPGPAVY